MTDLRPVLRILGVLLLMFGCTMAVPAAASLAFDDGIFSVYPRAMGLAWICGLLLWWSARHEQRELQARHGIILAKNEPAKKYGIQTAETVWQAKKKCPGLVLLPPHHDLYKMWSVRVNDIYERFTKAFVEKREPVFQGR